MTTIFSQQSHSVGKAHWEGECALDSLDRPAVPHFLAEDVLVQGLTDLSTSAWATWNTEVTQESVRWPGDFLEYLGTS